MLADQLKKQLADALIENRADDEAYNIAKRIEQLTPHEVYLLAAYANTRSLRKTALACGVSHVAIRNKIKKIRSKLLC